MNELSKYKYVANDFNDICNIIGEIEEITLNHAVDSNVPLIPYYILTE